MLSKSDLAILKAIRDGDLPADASDLERLAEGDHIRGIGGQYELTPSGHAELRIGEGIGEAIVDILLPDAGPAATGGTAPAARPAGDATDADAAAAIERRPAK